MEERKSAAFVVRTCNVAVVIVKQMSLILSKLFEYTEVTIQLFEEIIFCWQDRLLSSGRAFERRGKRISQHQQWNLFSTNGPSSQGKVFRLGLSCTVKNLQTIASCTVPGQSMYTSINLPSFPHLGVSLFSG